MIYSVHGKLIAKEPSMAVVECGGVGYGCRTTFTTLGQLGAIGETVFLYTVLSVREDAAELFGFATQQELQCFQLLTSVSGVGPKAALAILSDLTPDRFLLTVASGDSKTLTRSKGIGAKSAQRIVMELKDKIAGESIGLLAGAEVQSAAAASSAGGNVGEAIEALVTLGYTQGEVAPIVAKLDPSLSASELIRRTLQEFGKKRS
ncbi:Holliday junction branch migration protein RuvA [uncultured Ruminococcus sp.]|uniref:Holliday junction branch migration protein RuvA n=1 Tax=uncultured Ruminococcus sp. TaxID=165186 RepID=UPI0025CCF441|nr:Holliday junction branch migration protein RuvA [uncultured Ruminococcus sp.]